MFLPALIFSSYTARRLPSDATMFMPFSFISSKAPVNSYFGLFGSMQYSTFFRLWLRIPAFISNLSLFSKLGKNGKSLALCIAILNCERFCFTCKLSFSLLSVISPSFRFFMISSKFLPCAVASPLSFSSASVTRYSRPISLSVAFSTKPCSSILK